MASIRSAHGKQRSSFVVGLLCWSLIVFDGYDLTVFSTVLSHIAPKGWPDTHSTAFQKYLTEYPHDPTWHMTASLGGTIASMAFVGMAVGALFAGRIADKYGRRRPILWSFTIFSVFTIACAWAPNGTTLGLLRFLGGIGLGGLLPTAQTLASEYVDRKHRALMATSIMTGIPLGGVIASPPSALSSSCPCATSCCRNPSDLSRWKKKSKRVS